MVKLSSPHPCHANLFSISKANKMSLTNNISSKKTNDKTGQRAAKLQQLVKNSEQRNAERPASRDSRHNNGRPSAAPQPRVYRDQLSGFKASTRPFYHDTWQADGISHINMFIEGKTDLGACLSLDFIAKFTHPEFGDFSSLTAFHYFITRPVIDDSIRHMQPRDIRAKVRHIRAGGEDTVNPVNYRALMLEAMYKRIMSLGGLKKMVEESTLSFELYLPRIGDQAARRQTTAHWIIPGMEIIREAIIRNQHPGLGDFIVDEDAWDIDPETLMNRPQYKAPAGRSPISQLAQLVMTDPTPAPAKKRKRKAKTGDGPGIEATVNELRDEQEEMLTLTPSAYYLFADRQHAFQFMLDTYKHNVPEVLRDGNEVEFKAYNGVCFKTWTPEANLARVNFPFMVALFLKADNSVVLQLSKHGIESPFVNNQRTTFSIADELSIEEAKQKLIEHEGIDITTDLVRHNVLKVRTDLFPADPVPETLGSIDSLSEFEETEDAQLPESEMTIGLDPAVPGEDTSVESALGQLVDFKGDSLEVPTEAK